eukprot:TRINITY_DN6177_c0_g2_i1.p1 TRINITY_DN6177_c0_g2~~TRINITY_DN6177_c0_g2_i1.p1  ORF type:complete len:574 (+),score=100.33 TRINITY_DN6177_c0_g2_i1:121-1842(+)
MGGAQAPASCGCCRSCGPAPGGAAWQRQWRCMQQELDAVVAEGLDSALDRPIGSLCVLHHGLTRTGDAVRPGCRQDLMGWPPNAAFGNSAPQTQLAPAISRLLQERQALLERQAFLERRVLLQQRQAQQQQQQEQLQLQQQGPPRGTRCAEDCGAAAAGGRQWSPPMYQAPLYSGSTQDPYGSRASLRSSQAPPRSESTQDLHGSRASLRSSQDLSASHASLHSEDTGHSSVREAPPGFLGGAAAATAAFFGGGSAAAPPGAPAGARQPPVLEDLALSRREALLALREAQLATARSFPAPSQLWDRRPGAASVPAPGPAFGHVSQPHLQDPYAGIAMPPPFSARPREVAHSAAVCAGGQMSARSQSAMGLRLPTLPIQSRDPRSRPECDTMRSLGAVNMPVGSLQQHGGGPGFGGSSPSQCSRPQQQQPVANYGVCGGVGHNPSTAAVAATPCMAGSEASVRPGAPTSWASPALRAWPGLRSDRPPSCAPGRPQQGTPSEGGHQQCAICLEELVPGREDLRALACGHVYHHACVEEWLSQRRSCPLCTTEVVVEADRGGKAAAALAARRRPPL